MNQDTCEEHSRSLIRSTEGSAFIEYIALAGLFALVVGAAVFALGEPLLNFYQHIQLVWSSPFP